MQREIERIREELSVYEDTTQPLQFTLLSFKNIFRYLNLMFFPIQKSPILETAPGWVVFVFEFRTVIRVFLTLSIISYSFFGFVFGSRAVRFFIAWTYITLLPFTGQSSTGAWLNLMALFVVTDLSVTTNSWAVCDDTL